MTKLLDEAIESVRTLPEPAQDVAAEFLLSFVDQGSRWPRLTEKQLAEVDLAIQEVRDGKIATDADMDDVWCRFGR